MKQKDIKMDDEIQFEIILKQAREDTEQYAAEYPFDADETLTMIRKYESSRGRIYKFFQGLKHFPFLFRMRSKKKEFSFCASLLLFLLFFMPVFSFSFSHSSLSSFATNGGSEYHFTVARIDHILSMQ